MDAKNLLDQITVIVPTYKRDFFLSRICLYLTYTGFKNIIIADANEKQKCDEHRKYIECLNNPNLLYLEYPVDIYPGEKCYDALKNVTTPYSVFCSDKDFPLPKGVNNAINFLNNNLDFSVADGYYYSSHIPRFQCLIFKETYTDYYYSFQSESTLQRVFSFISHYDIPLFYSVHRSDYHRAAFKRYLDGFKGNYEYRFSEIILGLFDLCDGKYQRIDEPYWFRSAYGSSGASVFPNLYNSAMTGKLTIYYQIFENLLVERLMQSDRRYDAEIIRQTLKSGFNKYLSKAYPEIDQEKLSIKPKSRFDKLLGYFQYINNRINRKILLASCSKIEEIIYLTQDMEDIVQWTHKYSVHMEKDIMIPFE